MLFVLSTISYIVPSCYAYPSLSFLYLQAEIVEEELRMSYKESECQIPDTRFDVIGNRRATRIAEAFITDKYSCNGEMAFMAKEF